MNFFILRPHGGNRFGKSYAYAYVLEPQNVGSNKDNGVCPCCGSGLGMLPWLPPHRVKLSSSRYPDFLWSGGFDLVVTERFRKLYENSGLIGITAFDPPVEVVKVGRKVVSDVKPPPPIYHNIWYVRGGADLDDVHSFAKRPPGLCKCCRRSISSLKSVILHPDSWTGNDFFEAYGLPGEIIVTEQFKDFVLQNNLTNAELIPSEQYQF